MTRSGDATPLPRGVLVRATVAARRLGVSARTVRRWIACGTLAGRRVMGARVAGWFVYRDALDAFAKEGKT